MKIDIMGGGQTRLLSVSVKTLDDAGIINISQLCRTLGVHRSTFLSKVASLESLEEAILFYAKQQKMKNVN
jgi:hypothetical protein